MNLPAGHVGGIMFPRLLGANGEACLFLFGDEIFFLRIQHARAASHLASV